MTRPRVAVLFGGRSSEHGVSCLSAGCVLQAIDPSRYEVLPIGITREGSWLLTSGDPGRFAIRDGRLPEVTDGERVVLAPDPTSGGLTGPGAGAPGTVPVDVVFPVLHGPFGEDGTLQGLLDLAGVPYVGSGVLASAMAMDKAVAKVLLQAAGLTVAPAVVARAAEWSRHRPEVEARVHDLGLPVFVKPSRGGSSLGITRVTAWEDLAPAVDVALALDDKVLIEAAVTGREVECGVLEGADGRPEASVPAEIRVVGDHAFYDFEAKYLDGSTELVCPAELDEAVAERLRTMACRAFDVLSCRGLARVDFFVDAAGGLTVNEVNTMPGFTPSSMFPRMWAASGLGYPELVDRLLTRALGGAAT